MPSSRKFRLPSLKDPRFVKFIQREKNPKVFGAFSLSVKSLNNIANDSTVMENIKDTIPVMNDYIKEQEIEHKKQLKTEADNHDRCKQELNQAKRDKQVLSASLIDKDNIIDKYEKQCSNQQTQIDELNDALIKAKTFQQCSNCTELQQQLDQSEQNNSHLCRELAEANENEALLEAKLNNSEKNYEYCDQENDDLKANAIVTNKELDQNRNTIAEFEKNQEKLLNQLHTARENEEKWKNNYFSSNANAAEKESENNELRQMLQPLMKKRHNDCHLAEKCKEMLDLIISDKAEEDGYNDKEEVREGNTVQATDQLSRPYRNTEQRSDQDHLNLESSENRLALSENVTFEEATPRNPAPHLSQIEHEDNEEQFNWEPPAKRLALSTPNPVPPASTLSQEADDVDAAVSHLLRSAASTERAVPEVIVDSDNEDEED